MIKKSFFCLVFILVSFCASNLFASSALDKWKPDFDSSKAKYHIIVSNVAHPVIKGSYAGFLIRDELWKRTNGQIYFDYKPLSVLGGEVEVLNMLQMGAIQGMAVSSVAAANLGPRFGLINLPFLIGNFEKLNKFISSGKLFEHFMDSMKHQGILGFDITGYGSYGWASTEPIRTIEDAKKIKFRTARSSINQALYKNWKLNAVPMPWPDVQIALKQGVITGLDHAPITCSVSKKFEVAKYYTYVNYAQGLFIWVFNEAWFNSLPKELQKTFKEVVNEVCLKMRKETQKQQNIEIKKAKEEEGVTFFKLSKQDREWLKGKGMPIYEIYREEINKKYNKDKYEFKDYLQEVVDYLE